MQVHCVQAFGKLEEILREEAPLPDGLVLHSWGGSGAQVKSLSKLEGVYFSISGHSLSGSRKKIRPMLKQVGGKRKLPLTGIPDPLMIFALGWNRFKNSMWLAECSASLHHQLSAIPQPHLDLGGGTSQLIGEAQSKITGLSRMQWPRRCCALLALLQPRGLPSCLCLSVCST